jgi:DNA end-binding protein Ku
MASMLIDRKAGEFDAKEFHNRYVDALKGLIAEKQKRKGEKVIQDPDADRPSKGSNVIDLMAALKRSLGDDGANDNKRGSARKPAAKKAPAKKAATPAKKTAIRKRA